MGSSRRAGARLLNFLSDVQSRGRPGGSARAGPAGPGRTADQGSLSRPRRLRLSRGRHGRRRNWPEALPPKRVRAVAAAQIEHINKALRLRRRAAPGRDYCRPSGTRDLAGWGQRAERGGKSGGPKSFTPTLSSARWPAPSPSCRRGYSRTAACLAPVELIGFHLARQFAPRQRRGLTPLAIRLRG